MNIWVLVVTTAALGGLHCVGMCGGFPALLLHVDAGRNGWWRVMRYLAGKSITYAALGAVAGLGGQVLLGYIAQGQTAMAVATGVAFLVIGVGMVRAPRVKAGQGSLFARLMGRVMRARPKNGFVLGLVNGLLPCPLVYGMLAVAASTGSVVMGSLVMAVFGASTAPALLAAGWLSRQLGPALRSRVRQVGGVLLIVFGLLTMMRGLMPAHEAHTPASLGHLEHGQEQQQHHQE